MLNRKTPPPFERSTSFDLIPPITITLQNGQYAYFLSGGSQDVIRIDFIFNAGRWHETAWGVSHFASNLLNKGTKDKGSFDIAQIFDQYGAHVDVSAGLDYVNIALYSLTKNLNPVLSLLLEILTAPTFPEKELQQSKSIYLQNLKVNQEKTGFQASKLIRKNIFGDQHPYGKELDEADVLKIDSEQLRSFHHNFFGDSHVIASGKIEKDCQQLILEVLEALSRSPVKTLNSKTKKEGPHQQYEEKQGSVQTSIRMGKKSLLRLDADYVDVLFLNHILGGYFGSRLMKNIREEKGLTYGIYSSLHAMKHDSYMVIGADVNKENSELTFQEIRNELKRLRTKKVGEEELDTARFHFIGSLQAEITTPFAHADKFKSILLHGLDQNYYQNLIKRIDSIRAEELLVTAEKYFNEESYHEVAVG